ncbi:MAG: DinB family protein [Candidatus Cohnella colombiensis]|uniref:DinB family protein n=1 Tax=Candidatus Cohnella colombiensis TaxID=3121368 RepID=A0AA95EYZ3_9BACL|nr:MAG: DinB family protein [Cohnella sp.]
MKTLFHYNWQIRDEWLQVFESIPLIELLRDRKAGLGSFLKTLFHIIDAEYSWIRAIQNESDIIFQFEDYKDLHSMRNLSNKLRIEINKFINSWSNEMEYETVNPSWMDKTFYKGEVLRHILVHEIHHIGQLSIWSKEIGIEVVSSNFIGRELMEKK